MNYQAECERIIWLMSHPEREKEFLTADWMRSGSALPKRYERLSQDALREVLLKEGSIIPQAPYKEGKLPLPHGFATYSRVWKVQALRMAEYATALAAHFNAGGWQPGIGGWQDQKLILMRAMRLAADLAMQDYKREEISWKTSVSNISKLGLGGLVKDMLNPPFQIPKSLGSSLALYTSPRVEGVRGDRERAAEAQQKGWEMRKQSFVDAREAMETTQIEYNQKMEELHQREEAAAAAAQQAEEAAAAEAHQAEEAAAAEAHQAAQQAEEAAAAEARFAGRGGGKLGRKRKSISRKKIYKSLRKSSRGQYK